MFIPITSTSELRYWPFATVGLIVANIIAFAIQHSLPDIPSAHQPHELAEVLGDELSDVEEYQAAALLSRSQPGWIPYALSHGEGLRPIQWVTSMFMHVNALHLIGNLIFLWVFGHIVEGVVGHKMLLLLYVGLGVLGNMIEQVAFLAIPAMPSLGASGAIYTLMVLAAWFSPHDKVQGVIVAFYRFWFMEVPVLLMAGFYFLVDVALAMSLRLAMSTPLLHAIGGIIGLVAGFVLLRFGFVENDGQDALTLLRSMGGKDPEPIKPFRKPKHVIQQEKAQREAAEQLFVRSRKSLVMHAKAGNLEAANYQIRQLRQLDPRYQPDEEILVQLISHAQKQKRWNEAVSLSDQYLTHYAQRAVPVRLAMADMLVSQLGMPRRALKTLEPLANVPLNPKQLETAKKIQHKIHKSLAEGVLEPGD